MCVGKGGDYERLDEALKDLIDKGERDICICLLHGDQEVGGIEIAGKPGDRDLHIEIVGCGPGSRVTLFKPIQFSNVYSVVLRDLAIEIAFIVDTDARRVGVRPLRRGQPEGRLPVGLHRRRQARCCPSPTPIVCG